MISIFNVRGFHSNPRPFQYGNFCILNEPRQSTLGLGSHLPTLWTLARWKSRCWCLMVFGFLYSSYVVTFLGGPSSWEQKSTRYKPCFLGIQSAVLSTDIIPPVRVEDVPPRLLVCTEQVKTLSSINWYLIRH